MFNRFQPLRAAAVVVAPGLGVWGNLYFFEYLILYLHGAFAPYLGCFCTLPRVLLHRGCLYSMVLLHPTVRMFSTRQLPRGLFLLLRLAFWAPAARSALSVCPAGLWAIRCAVWRVCLTL
jgi:hypothetical protein